MSNVYAYFPIILLSQLLMLVIMLPRQQKLITCLIDYLTVHLYQILFFLSVLVKQAACLWSVLNPALCTVHVHHRQHCLHFVDVRLFFLVGATCLKHFWQPFSDVTCTFGEDREGRPMLRPQSILAQCTAFPDVTIVTFYAFEMLWHFTESFDGVYSSDHHKYVRLDCFQRFTAQLDYLVYCKIKIFELEKMWQSSFLLAQTQSVSLYFARCCTRQPNHGQFGCVRFVCQVTGSNPFQETSGKSRRLPPQMLG